jgi:hypothetical protein
MRRIARGIPGMSSSADDAFRHVQEDGVSPIFLHVKGVKVKKNFSGKEHNSRRISSKAPKKRLVAQGNDAVILRIIHS